MRVFKNIGSSFRRPSGELVSMGETFEAGEKEIKVMEDECWIGIRVVEIVPEEKPLGVWTDVGAEEAAAAELPEHFDHMPEMVAERTPEEPVAIRPRRPRKK